MTSISAETKIFLELAKGKKIVFTNGCFDLLHLGHVEYLRDAKSLGDYLIVGINSDESVRKLKGPDRPINSELYRSAMLLALKSVDCVQIFNDETPLELIKIIRPTILVKGGDWKVHQIVGSDFVQSIGGKVYSLKFIDGHSTTHLIKSVQGKK